MHCGEWSPGPIKWQFHPPPVPRWFRCCCGILRLLASTRGRSSAIWFSSCVWWRAQPRAQVPAPPDSTHTPIQTHVDPHTQYLQTKSIPPALTYPPPIHSHLRPPTYIRSHTHTHSGTQMYPFTLAFPWKPHPTRTGSIYFENAGVKLSLNLMSLRLLFPRWLPIRVHGVQAISCLAGFYELLNKYSWCQLV